MVKLVDTLASGASGLMVVEVQVLSWAPVISLKHQHSPLFAGFIDSIRQLFQQKTLSVSIALQNFTERITEQ